MLWTLPLLDALEQAQVGDDCSGRAADTRRTMHEHGQAFLVDHAVQMMSDHEVIATATIVLLAEVVKWKSIIPNAGTRKFSCHLGRHDVPLLHFAISLQVQHASDFLLPQGVQIIIVARVRPNINRRVANLIQRAFRRQEISISLVNHAVSNPDLSLILPLTIFEIQLVCV